MCPSASVRHEMLGKSKIHSFLKGYITVGINCVLPVHHCLPTVKFHKQGLYDSKESHPLGRVTSIPAYKIDMLHSVSKRSFILSLNELINE